MIFRTDKQTQDDLSILGRTRGLSLFDIYNDTCTRGGNRLLEAMFVEPLADYEKIVHRIDAIRYFYDRQTRFPFQPQSFERTETYLENTDERSLMDTSGDRMLQIKVQRLLKADTDFQTIHSGLIAVADIFNTMSEFLSGLTGDAAFTSIFHETERIGSLLDDETFAWMHSRKGTGKLSFEDTARHDQTVRYDEREKVMEILEFAFRLDVYISLAHVAHSKGFAFAQVLPAGENMLEIADVWHPQLENPVADNSVRIDDDNNVIFLTGANMAGKSTFMKSFAIAIYLAHMGLPVPARQMTFSVRNGLYTSINLADNLNWGYSHFYSEVMRIKKVAQDMAIYGNMVVIFDELFRGTNVKDAHDGTVAITRAFSGVPDSIFLISTHIIESGEVLRGDCPSIRFVYFPTVMEGNVPRYTYRLTDGITADRHGMIIIRNEGILEMARKNKQ